MPSFSSQERDKWTGVDSWNRSREEQTLNGDTYLKKVSTNQSCHQSRVSPANSSFYQSSYLHSQHSFNHSYYQDLNSSYNHYPTPTPYPP